MSVNKVQILIQSFISVLIVTAGLIIYHANTPHHAVETRGKASYFEMADHEVRLPRLSETSTRDFVRAAKKSTSSVVYIIAYQKVAGSVFSEGYSREKGSGVIISDDGYIVTNHHVVRGADFIEITLEDKREFVAEIIGVDERTDLALLKIEASRLPNLVFANSDSLQVGEWILAVGNPFGLQSTVTAGIVSAKARNIEALSPNDIESFIQSDAVINPGSSGGALVNTDGLLMGICTAILSKSGNYEGLSFAIPSNLARKVIIDLKQFGSVQRGKLGVTITDVNADIARQQKMDKVIGIYIDGVILNSAAAKAGLRTGDVIYEIEGREISSTSTFYEVINQYRPGDKLNIQYFRKGITKQTNVILRNYLNTTDYIAIRSDKELKDIGIEVRDLNSIEKSRVNTTGVMVVSISKGSTIAKTNMEPSFIIEYFNDEKLTGTKDFIEKLKNTSGEIKLVGFYERYPGIFPYSFSKD